MEIQDIAVVAADSFVESVIAPLPRAISRGERRRPGLDVATRKALFAESVIPECDALLHAAELGATADLARRLHRMKGVMMYLQARGVVDLIGAIERQLAKPALTAAVAELHGLICSENFARRYLDEPK